MTIANSEITCVLNAHNEGCLLSESFDSLATAVERARRSGIKIRIIVAADNPTDETLAVLNEIPNQLAEVHFHQCGDLANVRNLTIEKISSPFVSWLDGDDLWSSNWLVDSFLTLIERPSVSVVHPEYSIYYDSAVRRVLYHPSMDQRYQFTDTLYFRNLWTSLCTARTEIYRKIPYIKNSIAEGFGYEDWCWNMETVRCGYVHQTAPGTVHAIRLKAQSLSNSTKKFGAIPRTLKIYNKNEPTCVLHSESEIPSQFDTHVLNTTPDKSLAVAQKLFSQSKGFLSKLAQSVDPTFLYPDSLIGTPFHKIRGTYNSGINTVICIDFNEGEKNPLAVVRSLWEGGRNVLVINTGDLNSKDVCVIDNSVWEVLQMVEYCPEFHRAHWSKVLHVLVGEIAPNLIVNYNSDICSEMFSQYGYQLRQYCKLQATSVMKSGEVEANVKHLYRIRVALDQSSEIVNFGNEEFVKQAVAVTWSMYPRRDGWLPNLIALQIKRGVRYSFTVYLPKREGAQDSKKLFLKNLSSGDCREVQMPRGRRTRIEVLSQPSLEFCIIRLQCDAELTHSGSKEVCLGFVIINEEINLLESDKFG